jgi:hypothetical protein
MFSLLLMSNLYSKAKLNQISSPYASIEKYQSFIIDFQLIAEYLNPVDIKDSRADIFITSFFEKNMSLAAFCCQHIFNTSNGRARFSPIEETNNINEIPMKASGEADFSKSFSLNFISLALYLDLKETRFLPVNSSKMN